MKTFTLSALLATVTVPVTAISDVFSQGMACDNNDGPNFSSDS
jgi:hypothetical protein